MGPVCQVLPSPPRGALLVPTRKELLIPAVPGDTTVNKPQSCIFRLQSSPLSYTHCNSSVCLAIKTKQIQTKETKSKVPGEQMKASLNNLKYQLLGKEHFNLLYISSLQNSTRTYPKHTIKRHWVFFSLRFTWKKSLFERAFWYLIVYFSTTVFSLLSLLLSWCKYFTYTKFSV